MDAVFAQSRSKTTTRRCSFCVNTWQWMKYGSTTSLRRQIGSHLSGHQRDQRQKHQQARFWLPNFGMHGVFCPSITLRKEEPSKVNIILHYWCFWREKLQKISSKWRNKCFFTKTMHCVTSRSQQWQNYINCTSNCFRTHPNLQIWLPATSGCLQTLKEWSVERDFAPIKWYRKLRHIFAPKIVLHKKHRIVREVLESVYHPRRKLKVVLLLVRPGNYWVICDFESTTAVTFSNIFANFFSNHIYLMKHKQRETF